MVEMQDKVKGGRGVLLFLFFGRVEERLRTQQSKSSHPVENPVTLLSECSLGERSA